MIKNFKNDMYYIYSYRKNAKHGNKKGIKV